MAKSDLSGIAAGGAINLMGVIFGNALTYLFGMLIGHIAGVESVGMFFLALGLVQFGSAICRIGLPEGLLRFVPIYLSGGDPSRLTGIVIGAVGLAVLTTMSLGSLLFVLADALSARVFHQPDLAPYLRWAAMVLPLVTVMTLLTNVLQALKRPDLVVVVRDLVQPIGMLALLAAFVPLMRTPAQFLGSYLGSMALALAAVAGLVYKCLRPRPAHHPIFEWRRLLAFSLPIVASDVGHYALRWSDTFILSLLRSASDVGIYSAALRTTMFLNLLGMSVTALAAPVIAAHFHHGRHEDVKVTVLTLARWCLTLVLPLVLVVVVAAPEIMALWGNGFEPGVPAVIILVISHATLVISSLLGTTLLMVGRQGLEVFNTLVAACCGIAANLLLAPGYGFTGTALSMLLAQALGLAMRAVELRFVLNMTAVPIGWAKPLGALVLTGAIVLPLANLARDHVTAESFMSALAFSGVSFGCVAIAYLTFLYLLGIERTDVVTWREITARNEFAQL